MANIITRTEQYGKGLILQPNYTIDVNVDKTSIGLNENNQLYIPDESINLSKLSLVAKTKTIVTPWIDSIVNNTSYYHFPLRAYYQISKISIVLTASLLDEDNYVTWTFYSQPFDSETPTEIGSYNAQASTIGYSLIDTSLTHTASTSGEFIYVKTTVTGSPSLEGWQIVYEIIPSET